MRLVEGNQLLLPRVDRPASEKPSQRLRIDVEPQRLVTAPPSKFTGERPYDALRTVELSFEIISSEIQVRTHHRLDHES
ncbi:hypothetical protein MMMDOFMJ_3612 [Methylobacterium gnaphalii]|nr:hypothetical protein MMMDOFMJ_3612 [Methylobacterium gnaphalii]